MPRNARCIAPGLPYHVTQRGTNRQPVFFTVADRKMYLALLRDNLDDAGVQVLAYCLMGNHIHLVLVPAHRDSLAILLRRAHGRYAQYLNLRRHRSGHLWQNRFYSCPLSERHLWMALRYVEQNPVRAALVRRPGDYPWSSARVHLGNGSDSSSVLDLNFWRQAGGLEAWRAMHETDPPPDQIRLLRRCTYAGRPFGEESFVQRLEEQFQRRWRRWGFEAYA